MIFPSQEDPCDCRVFALAKQLVLVSVDEVVNVLLVVPLILSSGFVPSYGFLIQGTTALSIKVTIRPGLTMQSKKTVLCPYETNEMYMKCTSWYTLYILTFSNIDKMLPIKEPKVTNGNLFVTAGPSPIFTQMLEVVVLLLLLELLLELLELVLVLEYLNWVKTKTKTESPGEALKKKCYGCSKCSKEMGDLNRFDRF